MGVRSNHLVLRLGVDAHHARVVVGNSLAIGVFREKGLHDVNMGTPWIESGTVGNATFMLLR